MGIVKEELRNFEIDGSNYKIELNEGEKIHVHIDEMRISFRSIEEFKKFANTVIKGGKELRKKKENL